MSTIKKVKIDKVSNKIPEGLSGSGISTFSDSKIEELDFNEKIETSTGLHESFFDKYKGAKVGSIIVENADGSWTEIREKTSPNFKNIKNEIKITHKPDGSYTIDTEYNDSFYGHRIETRNYDTNGKLIEEYEYTGRKRIDEKGNTIITTTSYDGKDVLKEEIITPDGTTLSKIVYDNDGEIQNTYKKLEDGTIVKTYIDLRDSKHSYQDVYRNDELIERKEYMNGQLNKSYEKLNDGTAIVKEINEHNEITYESSTKNGIKEYRKYTDGIITEIGTENENGERQVNKYTNGKITSTYNRYPNNSEIKESSKSYENETIKHETIKYKNGRAISREYEDGQLKKEYIKNNEYDGEWRYYENGQLIKTHQYHNKN